MRIPRPLPITRSLFSFALRRKPRISDILRHRKIAMLLAASVTLHGAMAALFAWVVADVLLGFGPMIPALTFLAFLAFTAWAAFYLKAQSPVMSAFLWGGTVYVIDDGGKELSFTTEVGVAEHPSTGGVVEAVIPGVLFFVRAELRQFKPSYRVAQIEWTEEAITAAMTRQRAYRTDWE